MAKKKTVKNPFAKVIEVGRICIPNKTKVQAKVQAN